MTTDTPRAKRALRLPDVVAKTRLARTTIYALVKKGDFPKPFKLGVSASAWLESEVDDWLTERAEETR